MNIQTLWLWLLYGWVGMEVLISIATRTRRSQGSLNDRGTQILIWVVIVGSFFAAGWLELPRTDIHVNHDALRTAGLILIIIGLIVRVVAIATLGKAFSANVAIRKTQSVQRSGLYRFVRHPSYLGMELIFLAAGIHAHNWISLAILLIFPTAAVLYRIRVEEEALLGAFGHDYADYIKTTKRLIPGVY
jgi:protein-S-isoprenylcysteine O-methyltransferase Ste14